MSFVALNAALSGLRVAQQQLNLISNNVANVGTPGYTRKILPQSTQLIESTGQIIGVSLGVVTRNVDLNLERELWTQISETTFQDVKATYLNNVQQFHGSPDAGISIAAEISALKDEFAALSDAPADGFLLQSTLGQAQLVARKFNEYGAMVTQMRNDVQGDLSATVGKINTLLGQIADANRQIKGSGSVNRSMAGIEDVRDEAIKNLSELMDVTFFRRGDGVVVLQTNNGVELVNEVAREVYFNATNQGPLTYYPESANGIFVGGNPDVISTALDIADEAPGGKLGALLELRDTILPQYQAQMDELAHKLALRFDAQGLRLFTDPAGQVPADTPPDLTPLPPGSPVQPVEYVGFATTIQVNQDIIDDFTLLQQGTYTSDSLIPAGSNEVIRRIVEFTFGSVEYQQAEGDIDLRVAGPATDLQQWLGLFSSNTVTGGINLGQFDEISDAIPANGDLIDALGANFFPNYPLDDQFRITFEESRTGLGPTTVTIDLSAADTNFPIGAGINDALDQIISEINSQIALAGVPAGLAASATRNNYGQLVIQSRGNVTLTATGFANAMDEEAFAALGLSEGTYVTEDPYFDIQVGNADPIRITIEPGDTETDLVEKLDFAGAVEGIPGLNVDFDAATGFLTLRPGNDGVTTEFGGDLKITGGPFQTTSPVNAVLAGLSESVGIVSAIFGSFVDTGTVVNESNPVTDVGYGSETSSTAGVGSGVFVPFRNTLLGPGVNISSGILTATGLVDYGQKIVSAQAQDVTSAQSRRDDSQTLQDLIQRQFLDESAVNLDEELANLIVIQTAFAASARAVSAADSLFQELLEAVR